MTFSKILGQHVSVTFSMTRLDAPTHSVCVLPVGVKQYLAFLEPPVSWACIHIEGILVYHKAGKLKSSLHQKFIECWLHAKH